VSSRADQRAQAREQRRAGEAAARAARKRRLAVLGGAAALAAVVVVVLVIVGGGSDSGGPPGKGEAASGAAETQALFQGIPQRGTILGDPRAGATMLAYADLQCPFCRDYALNVLPALVDRYVRPGKLRMDLREIPLIGPDSVTASAWALAAARQNRLYQFADLFYRNQGQENSGYVTDAFLSKIASGAGMNVARARNYARSRDVRQRLVRTSDAARAAGVSGTPTFFVGRRGGNLQELRVASLAVGAFTRALDSLTAGK